MSAFSFVKYFRIEVNIPDHTKGRKKKQEVAVSMPLCLNPPRTRRASHPVFVSRPGSAAALTAGAACDAAPLSN